MTLHFPVQKLSGISQEGLGCQLVLAASGPTINTISLSELAVLYQWPSQFDGSDSDGSEDEHQPNKRRKLVDGRDPISRQLSEASDASIEIVAERKKGDRKKTKVIDTKLPNVSHVVVTADGKYAVAATMEDKVLRVFDVSPKGKLTQRSARSLPKKICALRLTKDEKTVLTADKFGDVYAVPLHQSESWVQKEEPQQDNLYKPAATDLTVHTKRNLEALRQQLEQKRQAKKKEGINFEHQLLLGHVSLLTDLAVAESIVNGQPRSFILSADRDEHIRVSRGIPQAHIIESFCLGHTEFVSRLCIPPSSPELLVVGNGEPSLRVYQWQTGRLLQIVPIETNILSLSRLELDAEKVEAPEARTYTKLAVSGIWPMAYPSRLSTGGREGSLLLVAIEGLPVLLTYNLDSEGLSFAGATELHGNVLDVLVIDSEQQLLVSIDNVHRPYSMKLYQDGASQQGSPFQLLKLQSSQEQTSATENIYWTAIDQPFDTAEITRKLPEAPELLTEESINSKGYERVFSNLGEFLYGLENLRKKRGRTGEEDDEVDMEAEEVESKPEEAGGT